MKMHATDTKRDLIKRIKAITDNGWINFVLFFHTFRKTSMQRSVDRLILVIF